MGEDSDFSVTSVISNDNDLILKMAADQSRLPPGGSAAADHFHFLHTHNSATSQQHMLGSAWYRTTDDTSQSSGAAATNPDDPLPAIVATGGASTSDCSGLDDNTATLEDGSSAKTNTSEAQPRGAKYLNALQVSREVTVVMVVICTLLIVIPVVFTATNIDGDGDSNNPSLSPTDMKNASALYQSRLERLAWILPNETLSVLTITSNSTGTASKNSTSTKLPNTLHYVYEYQPAPTVPQSQALDWLLEDPLLEDYSDDRVLQRFALATFYHAFAGPQWLFFDNRTAQQNQNQHKHDWLSYEVSECEWIHLPSDGPYYDKHNNDQNQNQTNNNSICHDNGTLARLVVADVQGFRASRSTTSMPPEIGLLLPQLQELHFENVFDFSGPLDYLLSPYYQQLSALKTFRCIQCELQTQRPQQQQQQPSTTKIQGSVLPSEIGLYMPHLQELDLMASHLQRTLPSELGLLTQLTLLNLQQNDFRRNIPSQFSHLTHLTSLLLGENKLEGPVPKALWSSLTQLRHVDWSSNALTGSLSSQIGLWTSLSTLQSDGNFLSGPLPSELGLLTALELLGLTDNEFTGRIPDQIVAVAENATSHLVHLALAFNELQGPLPMSIVGGALANTLQVLNVGGNVLSGSVPSELGLLTGLTTLRLQSNSFSGTLPSELGLLTALESFYVNDNPLLEEEVPATMCEQIVFDEERFDDFNFEWCHGKEECCEQK